jgi:hypothetical protein
MKHLEMLIIGLLLGIALMLVAGTYQSDETPFGFAVPANGRAIIKDAKGEIYFLDFGKDSAERVGVGVPNVGGPLISK